MPHAQRKPASGTQSGEGELIKWFREQGETSYIPLGLNLAKNLLRVCTALQVQIVLCIVDGTVGDYQNGRPAEAQFTYDDFREWGVDATDAGIINALDGLVEKKLIQRIEKKNLRAYRILYANFPAAEGRTPRQAPDKLPVVAKTGERSRLGYRQPMTITPKEPAATIEIVRRTNGEIPLEMETKVNGSHTRIELFLPEKHEGEQKGDSSPVKSLKPGAGGRDLTVVESLDALTPVFLKQFGKPLDAPFARKIQARLGETSPEAIQHLIALIQQRKPVASGIVLNICDDVRQARAEIVARNRKSPAAAPPPAYLDELPEDGTVPWARIKKRLRDAMAPQEFENWIDPTRQHSTDGRCLIIMVPDQITADFLNHEYAEMIRGFAWEVAELETFRCVVPEAAPAARKARA